MDATPALDTTDYRDGLGHPWVRPGLALLAVLTLASILLYAKAPQSTAEAGSRAWITLSPDAYTPRMSRARERQVAAQQALARGDTAAAVTGYAQAAEEARIARGNTADSAQASAATELWATMTLDRASLLLASGAAPWWHADNDALLREALASAERVRAVPTQPAIRARAGALAAEARRRLRAGPLEWIPGR
ncbi:MAG TPA: hypothetical protein VFE05_09685 [Longimicrobiaceae bacterium]|nr:hypothetical protein [Longimicrobiaceae bacterium]